MSKSITYKVTIYADGNIRWKNEKGQLHREDGPAVEKSCGEKLWYKNGKRHNENGPAVVHKDGTKMWYKNGRMHRIGKPAIERGDGAKIWYENGQRHREDGPAIEKPNGYKFWYIEGKQLSEQEFNNRNNVELTLQEIADKFDIDVNNLKIKK